MVETDGKVFGRRIAELNGARTGTMKKHVADMLLVSIETTGAMVEMCLALNSEDGDDLAAQYVVIDLRAARLLGLYREED